MWVLILTFYAGVLSNGDSVALTAAEFSAKEKCVLAGKKAQKEFSTAVKPVKFVCVEK